MKATLYIHADREQTYEVGRKLGLTGEALSMFSHACCEVKAELDVDAATGHAVITHVDGRPVDAEPVF